MKRRAQNKSKIRAKNIVGRDKSLQRTIKKAQKAIEGLSRAQWKYLDELKNIKVGLENINKNLV
jgi:hypothetical protein